MSVLQIKTELHFNELLKAVGQLNVDELDRLMSEVVSLRAKQRYPNLSEDETGLMIKINKGLSSFKFGGKNMEQLIDLSELKRFSIAEKILIIEEVWNSIVATGQEEFELTEEQRDELDRRLADYYSSPDKGSSWEEVKKRIRAMK